MVDIKLPLVNRYLPTLSTAHLICLYLLYSIASCLLLLLHGLEAHRRWLTPNPPLFRRFQDRHGGCGSNACHPQAPDMQQVVECANASQQL